MELLEQARINMVKNQIMPNKVYNQKILDVMMEIPRHNFVEEKWQDVAYIDARLPVGSSRKLLQPDVFARMLQEAEIKDTDKVLDIACGTGYSTLVIAHLANIVVGIDSIRHLIIKAGHIIQQFGLNNIYLRDGDLFAGCPEQAPFNVIFVNGVIHRPPQPLLLQLKNEGKLIAIEQVEGIMKVVKYQSLYGLYPRTELFDGYGDFL